MLSLLSPLVISSLVAALSFGGVARVAADAGDPSDPSDQRLEGRIAVDVPYVTQSELLCGGASAAMVFRFWGDAHAGVKQFATLADRHAGGITTTTLTDAVRSRGWEAVEFSGTPAMLRDALARGQPLVILLSEGRRRFHYVVVTAIDADAIWVHDPSWGPSRHIARAELLRRWKAADFWSLRILPSNARVRLKPDTTTPGTVRLKPDTTEEIRLKPDATHDRLDVARDRPDVTRDRPDATRDRPDATQDERDSGSVRLQPDLKAAGDGATAVDCRRLLDDAIDTVQLRGVGTADAVFGDVRARCPTSAGPVRELAGVRFAARQWQQAAALAREATKLDPSDTYAWDLLASARFVRDDAIGALEAWNHIGKPRVDAIRIEGLRRTRQAIVADVLGVQPDALLTPQLFRLAERRLLNLPDREATRIDYRPLADGFAIMDIGMTERATWPRQPAEWAAETVRTVVDREVRVSIPAGTGQGAIWTASWRWWDQRPRTAIAFSTPRTGVLPGVWTVDGSWETQTYAREPQRAQTAQGSDALITSYQQERLQGGLAVSNWLNASLRYEVRAGLDWWNDAGRAASLGVTIDRRLLADRMSLVADVTRWLPITAADGFSSGGTRVTFRSASVASGTTYRIVAGLDAVSGAAPLALWPGAGDGHARTPMLRGHPLLRDGVISGPVFGQRLAYSGFELARWIESPPPIRIGVAGFVDAARADHRADPTRDGSSQVDVGVGVRLRIPGHDGSLRVDIARGVRDGAHALTFGWQY